MLIYRSLIDLSSPWPQLSKHAGNLDIKEHNIGNLNRTLCRRSYNLYYIILKGIILQGKGISAICSINVF